MRTLIFNLLILTTTPAFAQTSEDVLPSEKRSEIPDSRHHVSLDGLMNYPIFLDDKDDSYRNFVDWGTRLSYVYATSNRFGVGMEYGMDFVDTKLNIRTLRTFSSLITSDDLNIEHEQMTLMVQQLMPKIEWKIGRNTKATGIYQQFGFGIYRAHVLEKEYAYVLDDKAGYTYPGGYAYSDAEVNFDADQFYNYGNKAFWGLSAMHSIVYRGKLTESLLWSVGLRTQFRMSTRYQPFQDEAFAEYYLMDQEDRDYWITRREMGTIISYNFTKTLFHLQFGLTYRIH